ncbi:hypothetical protein GCM10010404_07140 [Nonomuraea africana]|uniref:DUF4439 domain-containing protein n=1 Tax=Nonomuraea africana TaxID=46171 RepID=A0ABR9KKN8_9ACTN|nr:hypothetical protein [Nonomuraea africana]MBE1562540.1 hypothetical protein [Nonomuraea africana]
MRPLSRRAVLAGGAATAALSGCSAGGSEPAAPKAPDPEHVLLRELIVDKQRTIGLYSVLVAAGGEKLAPFLARHEEHLAALRERLPRDDAQTGSSPTPSAAPSPTPAPRKVSLTRLRDLERRAAALRPRQLGQASPALAQLIASIGACEALHALALPRSL